MIPAQSAFQCYKWFSELFLGCDEKIIPTTKQICRPKRKKKNHLYCENNAFSNESSSDDFNQESDDSDADENNSYFNQKEDKKNKKEEQNDCEFSKLKCKKQEVLYTSDDPF